MIAYKLFNVRADGTLGPLFIDKATVVPIGQWLTGVCVPTQGFAIRKGWHACLTPYAPHLALRPKGKRPRVWCKVELAGDVTRKVVPQGEWYIAERMRVLEVLPSLKGCTFDSARLPARI
jgi:hypothetical protein